MDATNIFFIELHLNYNLTTLLNLFLLRINIFPEEKLRKNIFKNKYFRKYINIEKCAVLPEYQCLLARKHFQS